MVFAIVPFIPIILLGFAAYRTFFKGRGKK